MDVLVREKRLHRDIEAPFRFLPSKVELLLCALTGIIEFNRVYSLYTQVHRWDLLFLCDPACFYHLAPNELRAPEDFLKRRCSPLDTSAMRVAYQTRSLFSH